MQSIWEMNFKDNVSSAVQSMRQIVGAAFGQMSEYERRFESDMGRMQSSMTQTNSVARELRNTFGMYVGISFFKELATDVIKTGAEMEQTRVAYETFIGDVGKATSLLKELKVWADFSPFDLKQTNDAGQALLAAGVSAEKLIPTMNVLGDLAQGNVDKFKMASVAYSKMLADGWADTRHINELVQDAGIPLFDQLKKMGWDRAKVKDNGGLPLEVIQSAFMKMTTGDGHFANMMEKEGQTLIGRWGTLMGGLQTESIKAFNALDPYLSRLVEWGISILPDVESAMRSLWSAMKEVGGFLKDHWELIKDIAIAVGVAVTWYYAYSAVMKIAAGLTWALGVADVALFTIQQVMAGATWESAAAMWGLNTAMLANPVFWLIGGVMALTAGIMYAWKHFESFRVLMYAIWETVKQVFTNIGHFFSQIFEPIFKAIEAFKAGHFIEAGKQIGIMAFNLTPVGMAVNTLQFAHEGGFTKDVAKAWDKGKKEGHDSWAESHKTSGAAGVSKNPLADHNIMGKYNGAAGGESGGKHKGSGGGGSAGRNITVTIQKMIGIENVYVRKLEDASPLAASKVTEHMIGSVRDFETGVSAES